MQHLKLKSLNHFSIPQSELNEIEKLPVDINGLKELEKSNIEGQKMITISGNGDLVQMFRYNFDGVFSFLPESDPIILYLNLAQKQLMVVYTIRRKIQDTLREKSNENLSVETFEYLSAATVCATYTFLALEAFINSIIPKDFKLPLINPENGKFRNWKYKDILGGMPVLLKLKKVPQSLCKKSFHDQFPEKWKSIEQLKSLRDDIVHNKPDLGFTTNWQEKLYNELFNFNFLSTIADSVDYINFYKEGTIEFCECSFKEDFEQLI